VYRRDAGRGAIVNTQVYDALGRKTQQSDPDSGTWAYAYNALGEQVAQTDLLGQATRQRYDARGRVIERISESAPGVIELSHRFVFDTGIGGKGQLAEESSTGGYAAWSSDGTLAHDFRRTYSYDSLGRPVGSVTRIDGAGYATVTRYDALGRAWQSQDASGNWLKTQFDARGFAAALCESSSGDTGATCNATGAGTYTRTLATDARGNVIHERRGGTSALDVIRTFDRFTGRLESVCSGGSCGIQDDRYAFDAAGNLIRRDIGGQYAEVFSYDPLNRLTLARYERVLATTWSPDTGPVSTEQRYDALGNICQKTIGATQQNYSYGGRAGCGLGGTPGSGTTSSIASPHAVTAAAGGVFFYDGHGNQVTADYAGTASDRFIRYSVEQQAHEIALASQTSPSQRSRFWYGSDGQRYKREDTATGQSTKRTLYLGSVEIIQQGGIVTTKRYIAGIVVQDITATAITTQYLFHDHIGSIVRVTNASGGIIEGMDFGAFGERRGYVDPRNLPVFPVSTNRGFTGHEMLDGLDVVHMNGRIYDSKLGRFLQADPIIQEPNNGQNFNRYSYVLNNPLSYTDPSGFSFLKNFFKRLPFTVIAIGIAAIAGPQALILLQQGSVAQALATAAVSGFLSGAIATTSLKGGLSGAFTGLASLGLANLGSLGNIGNSLASATVGGVSSALGGGKFGHGFISAGVTGAAGVNRISNAAARTAAAALVGGTVSRLTGGKFANGAVTGAMQSVLIGALRNSITGRTTNNQVIISGSQGEEGGAPSQAPLSAGVIGEVREGQDGPPAPFSTIEEAARAGLKAAVALGTKFEFAGAVIEVPGGFYATTPVTINDPNNFAFSLEPGVKPVAIFHTHPANGFGAIFSANDVSMAQLLRVSSFIGVISDNSIRVFDPITMRPQFDRRGATRTPATKGREVCTACLR
jgi:RHS repeat-associated protein